MISIVDTLFSEYNDIQKAVIKSAQGIKSFPGLKKQAIGTMMRQKSNNPGMSPNKSASLKFGAKKLGA